MQQRTMQIQLTEYGLSVMKTARVPPAVSRYELGSSSGYVADAAQTAIRGSLVATGSPSSPMIDDPNYLKYQITFDPSAAMTFGEIGLFFDNQLLAIAVSDDPVVKVAGTPLTIELYLPMVGTNYPMWFDYVQGANLRMTVLQGVESLPQAAGSGTNAYIVQGASSAQAAFVAFTDRLSTWVFDAYEFGSKVTAVLTGVTHSDTYGTLLHINAAGWPSDLTPSYLGKVILQFTSGDLLGICRYLVAATVSADGQSMVLQLNAGLLTQPAVGDTIELVVRDGRSTTMDSGNFASHDKAGAVIIGNTLTINNGILDINPGVANVSSVNGKTGAVHLVASDFALAPVATSGSYADLTDKPVPYALPRATKAALGGIIVGSSGQLTINNGILDFNGVPVKTINSVVAQADGSLNITGFVFPTESAVDMNDLTVVGLYYAAASAPNAPVGAADGTVQVSPSKTGVIQTWNDGNVQYQRAYRNSAWSAWTRPQLTGSSPVTSVFGRIGDVLLTSSDVSTALGFVPYNASNPSGYTTAADVDARFNALIGGAPTALDTLGELATELNNNESAVASIVTSLGSKSDVGHQHVIADTTGLVSALAAKASIADLKGVAFSGNYNDLSNKPAAYALPAATATTIGGVKPGTNLAVALDGTLSVSGLATVATSGSYNDLLDKPTSYSYTLPNASATVVGGVKIGTGLTVEADGTLSISPGAMGGVSSFNTRTGAITLTSADVTDALGFTPYSSSNPSGYQTAAQVSSAIAGAAYSLPTASTTTLGGVKVDGSTIQISGGTISAHISVPVTSVFGRTGAVVLGSSDVTGALGFTPYDSSNPSGYQTATQVSNAIASAAYSLPVASTTTLGGVKVDGSTITINSGVISSPAASGIFNFPGAPVTVNSTDGNALKIVMRDAGTVRGYLGATATAAIQGWNSSAISVFSIDNSGNFVAAGDVTAYSDARKKFDVQTIEDALAKVNALRGVTWRRLDSGANSLGVIAQEVQLVIPEVVHEDAEGYLSVAYGNLCGLLIEALKEVTERLAAVEANQRA